MAETKGVFGTQGKWGEKKWKLKIFSPLVWFGGK